jgi:hypothetical protein
VDECKPLVIGSDAHILELNKASHPFAVTPAVFGSKAGGLLRTSDRRSTDVQSPNRFRASVWDISIHHVISSCAMHRYRFECLLSMTLLPGVPLAARAAAGPRPR